MSIEASLRPAPSPFLPDIHTHTHLRVQYNPLLTWKSALGCRKEKTNKTRPTTPSSHCTLKLARAHSHQNDRHPACAELGLGTTLPGSPRAARDTPWTASRERAFHSCASLARTRPWTQPRTPTRLYHGGGGPNPHPFPATGRHVRTQPPPTPECPHPGLQNSGP